MLCCDCWNDSTLAFPAQASAFVARLQRSSRSAPELETEAISQRLPHSPCSYYNQKFMALLKSTQEERKTSAPEAAAV